MCLIKKWEIGILIRMKEFIICCFVDKYLLIYNIDYLFEDGNVNRFLSLNF